MDLFGIKEHDERHDEVERQLRRLIEQVSQLTIDLGVTRTQMRSLQLQVDGKVAEADLDPSVVALNQGIKEARAKLAEAEAAADDKWGELLDGLSASIDNVREQTTAAES